MTTSKKHSVHRRALVHPDFIIRLPVHPLADSFPRPDRESLMRLAADMQANGQHDPIIVCDGVLIDGRSRAAAAVLAGIKVKVEYYVGLSDSELEAMIVSQNTQRRSLSPATQAFMALSYYDSAKSQGLPVTIPEAAARFGASVRTVKRRIADRKPDNKVPKLSVSLVPAPLRAMKDALWRIERLKSKPGKEIEYDEASASLHALTKHLLSMPGMPSLEDFYAAYPQYVVNQSDSPQAPVARAARGDAGTA